MKINENFVLRELADTYVVLPLAHDTVDFSGMITLNESGVMLWKCLEQGTDVAGLVSVLLQEYDVSPEIARADVEEFLQKLRRVGCLVEDSSAETWKEV